MEDGHRRIQGWVRGLLRSMEAEVEDVHQRGMQEAVAELPHGRALDPRLRLGEVQDLKLLHGEVATVVGHQLVGKKRLEHQVLRHGMIRLPKSPRPEFGMHLPLEYNSSFYC